MKYDQVKFVIPKPTYQILYKKAKFEFQKEKGWHWLQKLCIKILAKIGAFSQEEILLTENVVVDCGSFRDNIQKQLAEAAMRFDFEPSTLVIGSKTYHDFMKETYKDGIFFDFGIELKAYRGGIPILFGLDVLVVPWMEGMIVMPNTLLKKHGGFIIQDLSHKNSELVREKEALNARIKHLEERLTILDDDFPYEHDSI